MIPVLVLAAVFPPPMPLLVRVFDLGHPVQAFAVSVDGQSFAAARDGNWIDIHDASTGKVRHSVRFNDGDQVRALAFSPDGRTLVGGADSNAEARAWSVESGQQTLTVSDHSGGACALAFAPDGKTLATASRDGTVRLIEPETGKVRALLGKRRETPETLALAFDPAGRWLAIARTGRPIQLADPLTGRLLRAVACEDGPDVPVLAVSADGRTLLSARSDRGYDVWETATGKRRWMTRPDALRAAVFAPDGRSLAVAFASRVEVRGPRLGEPGTTWSIKGECVACAGGGGRLFIVGVDVRVWLWPANRPNVVTIDSAKSMNSSIEELADLLAGPDAARAHSAIGTLLTRDPAEVVRLAKPALRALPVAGPRAIAEVRRLVPDLAHDDFRVRDAASLRLLALARAAPVEVMRAAKDATDPEAATRLAEIVRSARLAGLDINIEAGRWLEVLELLDTPAARAVVAELAAGDAEAELTRDAIATLKRLQLRRATSAIPTRP